MKKAMVAGVVNASTEDELNEIIAKAEQKKKEMAQQRAADKQAYNDLKEETVTHVFHFLSGISETIGKAKERVFENFKDLLDMKMSVFELSDEDMLKQQSHTFTNEAGQSVKIGHNVVDGYDEELLNAGTQGVIRWLESKVTPENKVFIGMIRDLLRPNKEGVLKASRVLELANKAREIGDTALIKSVEMMVEAYKPVKTSSYVKASYKNEKGETVWLALSMSQA